MGRDLRHAWRAIGRMRALAFVIVLSVGAGIGVNAAVFSWLQAIVLNPVPGVRDSGGFHFIEPRSESGAYPGASWREFLDLRERLHQFRDLAAFRLIALNVGDGDRTERTYGLFVSGGYFDALALRPEHGRLLSPAEVVRPGADPVVVVSHAFWQTRLAGRSDVVGARLRVNNRDLTIIGVTPERFQGTVIGLAFDLWVPATLAPELVAGSRELDERGTRGYSIIGRLQPHARRGAAQSELDVAMRELAAAYPDTNRTIQGEVIPFWWSPRGPQRLLLGALGILQAILLLLLLAVCGNTASLMLARASTRQREIGVRLALGASRWRIARLLLTENVLLGSLGAAVGTAFAVWGTNALRAMPEYGAFPVKFQSGVDLVTLAFAVALGVACGALFGLAPTIQLARVNPQATLRSGTAAGGRHWLRNALMAIQVGLALMVLVAAGIFLENFADSQDTDPGFRRDGVLLAAYDLSSRNPDAAAVRGFTVRLLDRIRALPGVDAAAVASAVPLDIHGLALRTFTLEGRARTDGAADEALTNTVTSGYFDVLGIPLMAGRDFAGMDDPSTVPQAIVNEEFVHRYLDGADPLGRRLESRGRTYVIVGVARNSVYEAFGEPPKPIIYLSYRDRLLPAGEVHLRVRPGADSAAIAGLRTIIRALDPTLPLYNVRTMPEHIEKNLFLRRIPARMFAVIGPLLLVLAAIGIYAVVSYAVARRTTEIAVRLALGATSQRVVGQIVAETLRVVAVGAGVGWFFAFDVVRQFLPEAPFDPVIFLGVPAMLIGVAALAGWWPARRAAKVNPAIALRET
jgi:predicted permease